MCFLRFYASNVASLLPTYYSNIRMYCIAMRWIDKRLQIQTGLGIEYSDSSLFEIWYIDELSRCQCCTFEAKRKSQTA